MQKKATATKGKTGLSFPCLSLSLSLSHTLNVSTSLAKRSVRVDEDDLKAFGSAGAVEEAGYNDDDFM